MRPLIRLGHDIDLLNPAKLIDLCRKAVLAGPFRRRPRRALLRMGILVILALEAEGLITPSQFEKTENLFEGFTINPISLALVTQGGADIDFLRHLIEP